MNTTFPLKAERLTGEQAVDIANRIAAGNLHFSHNMYPHMVIAETPYGEIAIDSYGEEKDAIHGMAKRSADDTYRDSYRVKLNEVTLGYDIACWYHR